ncbi:hypothetical protein D3C87_1806630 [compost metagenome]
MSGGRRRGGDFDTKMFGQGFQASGKALGHAAEFPLALAAIELAKDECSFLHASCRKLSFNPA